MKYSIDQHLMDRIDNEEKAYWLGFFYADAFNNEKRGRIVIELASKDKDHLYKCANFFGQPREPFEQLKNKGKYFAHRLELNSKYLSNVLKEKGCPQNKSFVITFPQWLDEKLHRHFVRGYFDGDGSIWLHQNHLNIEIVSTSQMNLAFQNKLKEIGINSQIKHPPRYKNNTCVLYSGGNKQIAKFCEWIYYDSTIFMNRKYQIYVNHLK